ncbi:hypothetical protein JRQ81_019515 [Phrynocephalus forsythii]|uniref:NADH dehydrogenase [ubiquinone] 1 subunit C2 n=1 Tax=Phrynocephalus forsythii TaxID=171643 RepID=A0A9Q1AY20_9SAUR|nr:hypothetical protein JRQ81_019515 [Phrynocephalus forsythii]
MKPSRGQDGFVSCPGRPQKKRRERSPDREGQRNLCVAGRAQRRGTVFGDGPLVALGPKSLGGGAAAIVVRAASFSLSPGGSPSVAMVFSLRIPDEVRSLPPQPWLNWCTVTMSVNGWLGALLDNAVNNRPILATGVHRQVLWASAGFAIGYYLMKRCSWKYAKRDKELEEYMKLHPEDFKRPEPKRLADVLEDFHPIR